MAIWITHTVGTNRTVNRSAYIVNKTFLALFLHVNYCLKTSNALLASVLDEPVDMMLCTVFTCWNLKHIGNTKQGFLSISVCHHLQNTTILNWEIKLLKLTQAILLNFFNAKCNNKYRFCSLPKWCHYVTSFAWIVGTIF